MEGAVRSAGRGGSEGSVAGAEAQSTANVVRGCRAVIGAAPAAPELGSAQVVGLAGEARAWRRLASGEHGGRPAEACGSGGSLPPASRSGSSCNGGADGGQRCE